LSCQSFVLLVICPVGHLSCWSFVLLVQFRSRSNVHRSFITAPCATAAVITITLKLKFCCALKLKKYNFLFNSNPFTEQTFLSEFRPPGAWNIKHFTAVITSESYSLVVFVTARHFHPGLTFAGRVGAFLSGAPYRAPL